MDICDQNLIIQTVEQLMSYIKKCVLLYGGLEVSFSVFCLCWKLLKMLIGDKIFNLGS